MKVRFESLVLIAVSICFADSARSGRDYNPRLWENCPVEMPMRVNMTFPPSNINKLKFSGNIAVSEEIPGEIELVFEPNKCTLDMKTCEKYGNINIREMCSKFEDKSAFYSATFAAIKPAFKCPIQPGNYTWESSTLELTPLAMFPLDGFVWVASIKLVSSVKGSKTKKTVLCLNSETKIVRVNIKS